MHTWVGGWDWLWMTLMMGSWLVVLGVVIYVAVQACAAAADEADGRLMTRGPTG